MIKFDEVTKYFQDAERCMRLNEELTFTTERPKHAVWIDNNLMARLFYQASQEWLKCYTTLAEKYVKQDNFSGGKELDLIDSWTNQLARGVQRLREKILSHPVFSKDKLVLEYVQ